MRWFALASGFIGLTAALLASCNSPTHPKPLKREFTLTTFEGVAVPGVYGEGPHATAEVLSGEFLLSENGSCGCRLSFRLITPQEVSEFDYEASCTWTREGDTLMFSWTHADPSAGTLVGPHLTVIHRNDVMCLIAPCPSMNWTAEYQEIRDR
jgi:hypothetical protein